MDKIILHQDEHTTCCVCFTNYHYLYDTVSNTILSLSDIEKSSFDNNEIPKNLLVKSCCNVHYICISCIHRSVNNYENHPINESNSHFACPYPFKDCVTSIGFKNVFDHNLIKKICNENEWENYIAHAENFAFPGYTIIKCPIYYYKYGHNTLCDTEILLENDSIKNSNPGDLIVECTQNQYCLRRFCFNCKQVMGYYSVNCNDCKTNYENENPNVLNYYFNKNTSLSPIITNETFSLDYNEESYLYLNKEITVDIAVEQIMNLINDIDTFFICAICKISLYKTERCNGLSHHNVERCYACGRIGYKTKGLGDHWNPNGTNGCFRFNTDYYVKNTIPHYLCNDTICYNHDKGDCNIFEHQDGIKDLEHHRKSSYVYHSIKSLLPEIRFNVYDQLYNKLQYYPDLLKYLPLKQTLVLLTKYKSYYKDISEDVFYKNINCYNPKLYPEYVDSIYYVLPDEFIQKYTINYENYNQQQETSISSWRRLINQELTSLEMTRHYIVDDEISDDTSENINDETIQETPQRQNIIEYTRPREYNYLITPQDSIPTTQLEYNNHTINQEIITTQEIENEYILNQEIENEYLLNQEIENEYLLNQEIENQYLLNQEIENQYLLNQENENEYLLNQENENEYLLNQENESQENEYIFNQEDDYFLNLIVNGNSILINSQSDSESDL